MIDRVVGAILATLEWVTRCEQNEPESWAEWSLHAASCLLRLAVFAVGTYVIIAAVIRLVGTI